MIKKIILFIVLLITFLIFKKHEIVQTNIIYACDLFIKKIFPSLFPMFIISSILINLNPFKYLNLFSKINKKFFNINSNVSYILLMSIISGTPSNAKIAKEMYDKNLLSKIDIQKILLFSHFSSPLFIMSMAKSNFLLIIIAHYISNFIIGIFTRNLYVSNYKETYKNNFYENNNFSQIFINSINNSLQTLLFILGTIVTSYILSSILNIPIFNILLEVSQGLNYINTLNLTEKLKSILFVGLISFGGICIHFQVYGILSDLKIKYYPYLLARICQSLISIFIVILFF